jgi:putative CocE/NonD family hydrolase
MRLWSFSAALLLGGLALAPVLVPGGEADSAVDLAWGIKVPLRDGVNLNATVYKPPGAGKLPAVFTLTPYIADNYHDRALYFARHGYVFVLVDARGRGSSEGTFEPFVNEGRDGHDVVLWLAKQPWCDGKVAMWGGSYAGFNQWATLREFPAPLATIVPAAAAHFGVDFPAPANIFPSYIIRWLTLTSGKTPNQKLFGETSFWNQKYTELYRQHLPFHKLDEVVGNTSTHFQTWLKHRAPDSPYWTDTAPGPREYERLNLPILTITGHYDDDQPGAMAYYHRHMRHGSAEGKAKHYLIMGPWDHAGTRTPTEEVGGVRFGKDSLLDLNGLHREWYDWVMKDGKKPAFLKDRVAYYVAGAEKWQYAAGLDAIPVKPRKVYLRSAGEASDVFRSGTLTTRQPDQEKPDRYTYDPLDVRPGELEREDVKNYVTDQRGVLNLFGNGLVYHGEPFAEPTEITGYLKFVAWVALDVPDTDFQVTVYEVKPDGSSIALTEDRMRARYRESPTRAVLVKPGEVNRYEFRSFTWFSRQLAKGSRLRLVFRSPNSIHWEKNYNSGGPVERESKKDARTAHVTLHQDAEHASYL